MTRVYLTNDSYPELRHMRRQWQRTATWWRAIRRATRAPRFWAFLVVQAAILVAALFAAGYVAASMSRADLASHLLQLGIMLGGLLLFVYLQASWGGDMMRPHLRAVSPEARYACPCCGQSLYGHLSADGPTVQCPECATIVDKAVFDPPYPIPAAFKAFPPWRGSGRRD